VPIRQMSFEIDALYYRKCHVRLQWRLLDWDGVVRNMLSLSPGLKDRYIFEEARTKSITLIARRRMTMQILLNLRFGRRFDSGSSFILMF
jgi:hypothetical protein